MRERKKRKRETERKEERRAAETKIEENVLVKRKRYSKATQKKRENQR